MCYHFGNWSTFPYCCGYYQSKDRIYAILTLQWWRYPSCYLYGSKSLNKWQKSYGPTKLERLGVITAVKDCASYIRGNHVIVECDHQALKPLFFSKSRGAIFDSLLTILVQNDLDIQYKPAGQMVVADALSRCHSNPNMPILEASPDKHDPHLIYLMNLRATSNYRQEIA